YGRNFNEITRFIRSRRHRTTADHQTVTSNNSTEPNSNNLHSGNNLASSSNVPTSSGSSTLGAPHSSNASQSSTGVNTALASNSDLNTPCGGRTREQVRFFYQQTWHKIRRYVKYPDEVPQHVREVYAIVNYSVIRTRIKKRKFEGLICCFLSLNLTDKQSLVVFNNCESLFRRILCFHSVNLTNSSLEMVNSSLFNVSWRQQSP
ncbi:unnamed protein product, partial [Trichobilharzia regenti]